MTKDLIDFLLQMIDLVNSAEDMAKRCIYGCTLIDAVNVFNKSDATGLIYLKFNRDGTIDYVKWVEPYTYHTETTVIYER